jgi:hypothetical protein
VKPQTTPLAAFWPALLGVLAAHQIAYSGHDDGHVHGYLDTVGPALVVAAALGWIWSWARSRVEFRTVLTLQLVLFAGMEGTERLAVAGTFTASDLAPIGMALMLIPLVAALTVLTHRVVEVVGSLPWGPVSGDRGFSVGRRASAGPRPACATRWSIRAPPSRV